MSLLKPETTAAPTCLGAIAIHVNATYVLCKTVWPSGLRRWLQAPVRKGVGSNPTAVTFSCWNMRVEKMSKEKEATARGFEPLRAEPNGFLVHHLNHSVTLSVVAWAMHEAS